MAMQNKRLTRRADDYINEHNYIPLAAPGFSSLGISDCHKYCEGTVRKECAECAIQQAFNRLGELEDKLENGTLLYLPVPIGTPVYVLCHNNQFINTSTFRIGDLSQWGTRVFKTPEAAQKIAPNAVVSKKVHNA